MDVTTAAAIADPKDHWDRLAKTLADAGIEPVQLYTFRDDKRIAIDLGDRLIEIRDAHWRRTWTGWQTWIEVKGTGLSDQVGPRRTKKRGEVRDAILTILQSESG